METSYYETAIKVSVFLCDFNVSHLVVPYSLCLDVERQKCTCKKIHGKSVATSESIRKCLHASEEELRVAADTSTCHLTTKKSLKLLPVTSLFLNSSLE